MMLSRMSSIGSIALLALSGLGTPRPRPSSVGEIAPPMLP